MCLSNGTDLSTCQKLDTVTAEERKEENQREMECIGLNYLSVPNHVILCLLTGVGHMRGIGADSLLKIHVSIQTFRLPLRYDHPSDRDKAGRRSLDLTQGTILRYLNPAPRVSGRGPRAGGNASPFLSVHAPWRRSQQHGRICRAWLPGIAILMVGNLD